MSISHLFAFVLGAIGVGALYKLDLVDKIPSETVYGVLGALLGSFITYGLIIFYLTRRD